MIEPIPAADEQLATGPDPEVGAASPLRTRVGVAIGRALLLLLITTAATAGVVGYQVSRNPGLSPIDEATYVDYLAKVNDGHFIIGRGETWGAYASKAVACRGIGPNLGADPKACDSALQHLNPSRNTADIDPPFYYLVTDVGARTLMALGVTGDLITAGRLVGILWGGAALAAIYLLSLLLGASRTPSALITAVALMTSGFWNQWSHITPHATDMLLGAAAMIAVLQWTRRRVPGWVLPLAGAIPVLFKATGVTIVAASVLFLIALALWPATGRGRGVTSDRPRSARELVTGAGMMTGGLALAAVGWLVIRNHYAISSVNNFPQYDVDHFSVNWLIDGLGTFAQSYQNGLTVGLAPILTIWMFGSVVHQLSDRSETFEIRMMSFSGLVIAIFGAWLYIVSNYVLLHQHVAIPTRYGLTVMPLLFALTARNLRTRSLQVIASVYLILLLVNLFHPF